MNLLKKLVASATLTAMIFSTTGLNAAQCYENCGGCGYEECRRAPCIGPAVALGAIAIAAIIAVAIQSSSNSHDHFHCHD